MSLSRAARWVLYAVCVAVSQKFANAHWVVGPVFGLTVAAFDAMGRKDADWARRAGFVATSTLIYALVYQISTLNGRNDSELFEYFFSPFSAGVVSGSVLLPLAHAVFFRRSFRLAKFVSLALVVSYYLVTLLAFGYDHLGVEWGVPWIAILVGVWQGVYLRLFTAAGKKH